MQISGNGSEEGFEIPRRYLAAAAILIGVLMHVGTYQYVPVFFEVSNVRAFRI